MKRWICAALITALLLGCLAPTAMAAPEPAFHGYLIGVPEMRLQAARALDADVTYVCDGIYYAESLRDVDAMREAGLVEYVEPNYPMELMASQWNMDAVHAPVVWSHQDEAGNFDHRGTGVTIAVIDSGVNPENPDFNPERILPCFNPSGAENGLDIWHGTFVAGLIAAQVDNDIGINGAASDVTILPICITKDGKSDTATAISAIDYAVKNGADVINLSIGSTKTSTSLSRACRDAESSGVIMVAAAGNYESETAPRSSRNLVYPAAYDTVISVSGLKNTVDGLAFDETYSYYNNKVDVCAPGSKINSLYNSSIASASGTSFAAPLVSAMAALAKQVNPDIDTDLFRTLLKATSTDLGDEGYDVYYGYGAVDMAAFCDALDEEYPITYISGGEEAEFSGEVVRSYSLHDRGVTLPTPVREGYVFRGWYESASLFGRPVSSIPSASTGARTFYASWQEAPNSAPAVTAEAPTEAFAAPASCDGLTPAVPYQADLSGWFRDPEGDAFTITQLDGPGALRDDIYTFTPAESDAGRSYSLRFQAKDAKGAVSAAHTVALHVGAVPNSAPVTAESPGELSAVPASRDGAVAAVSCTADVTGWFRDPDGDSLSYAILEGPGRIENSTYMFTPDCAQGGQSLSVTLCAEDDAGARSPEVSFRVVVDPTPNSAPVLSGLAPAELFAAPASLDGKTPAQSCEADISGWFRDPDGDPLTYELMEGPGGLSGSLYTYTPAPEDGGKDLSLLLRARDGSLDSPDLRLTLHIASLTNSAPTLAADGPEEYAAAPASLDGLTEAQAVRVDISDRFLDPDGDELRYRLVEGPGELSGSVYTYTPAPEDAGKEITALVQAVDAGNALSPTLTLKITVGPLPASKPIVIEDLPVPLNLCQLPKIVVYALCLYGSSVTDVTLGGLPLSWEADSESLIVTVPENLSEGEYTLRVSFDTGDSFSSEWIVGRQCPSEDFRDISVDAWYHSYVDEVVRRGLMQGMSADTFAPNRAFTRAMLVTVLYRMAGEPEVQGAAPFSDVPAGKWYSRAVAWAAENGIVNGVAPGRFAPDDSVTREQMVVILFRYAGDDGIRSDLEAFPDAADTHSYAINAMRWAIGHGYLSGVSGGGTVTLSPRAGATRAQVAAILTRFLLTPQ